MLRYLGLLLVVLVVVPTRLDAASDGGEACFTGDVKKHVVATVGDGLKFESDFYRFEFSGKTALSANGTVKNASSKTLHGAVYVAFFDKDKHLIASGSRTGILLAPGKSLVASNVLEVPGEALDRITSYQITIYESEKDVGQK